MMGKPQAEFPGIVNHPLKDTIPWPCVGLTGLFCTRGWWQQMVDARPAGHREKPGPQSSPPVDLRTARSTAGRPSSRHGRRTSAHETPASSIQGLRTFGENPFQWEPGRGRQDHGMVPQAEKHGEGGLPLLPVPGSCSTGRDSLRPSTRPRPPSIAGCSPTGRTFRRGSPA